MKSKIEDDSGETCRRMILDPSQAALDMLLSMHVPLGQYCGVSAYRAM